MLRSIKQLLGDKLGASDGEIGHVKDFYFDARNWAIRYVVVDTGAWLPGRKVLISPHAFRQLPEAGDVLRVNLTRKQIEDSPSIDTHKPVSRRYEENYYQYYGWPTYWQGDALWGMSGLPVVDLTKPFPIEPKTAAAVESEAADGHLRSTQAVVGYHLQATDGGIGHICDFLMDPKSWAIGQLVIRTGHRLSGREVQIPTSEVDRIGYQESTVFVNCTIKTVEQSPVHDTAMVAIDD